MALISQQAYTHDTATQPLNAGGMYNFCVGSLTRHFTRSSEAFPLACPHVLSCDWNCTMLD